MATRLRCPTVTALTLLILSGSAFSPSATTPADRMEALVQADRSASAASWKFGLRQALIDACDAGAAFLLPGAPLVFDAPGVLREPGSEQVPLSSKLPWDPLGLEMSADSSLAIMWGTTSLPLQPEAPATGRFVCVWRFSQAGWKIAAMALQGGPAFTPKGPDLGIGKVALPGPEAERFMKADGDFAALAADSGAAIAFQRWAAPDAMMFGRRGFIIRGPEVIGKAVDGPERWSWKPVMGGGSTTGDLGWTTGLATITSSGGATHRTKYLSVWKTMADGSIKFVIDTGSTRP